MVGIYKITNPSGAVYIGQSREIEHRWYRYRKYHVKGQRRILNSLLKYGPENHSFEVVCELSESVTKETLDNYEDFYIDMYRICGKDMMNLKGAGSRGKLSEESRKKMSESKRGKCVGGCLRKRQKEIKKKEKLSCKKRGRKKGFKHSEDVKKKMSETKRNFGPEKKKEVNKRISVAKKGKKQSPEHIMKRVAATVRSKINNKVGGLE